MSARVADINGWYEVKGNPLSKVGVFPYLGRSIPGTPDPDKVYMVYRPAEELADPECIASFKLLPWVDDHTMLGDQREGLTPAEKKGIAGVIGEDVYFQNNTLFGNIKVFSEALKEQIENGKKELSCGYRCVYEQSAGVWNGQPFDYIQRKIRGNHLALVEEGRMGPDVAVLDSMVFTLDAKDLVKMADEENKEGTGKDADTPSPTLEALAAQIGQIMEFVNKLKPLEEKEHGTELDAGADPEAPAKDAQPEGAAAADEDPAPAAMDAAEKALSQAMTALKSRNASAMDAALASVKAASDALAKAKKPAAKSGAGMDAAIKGLQAEISRLKKDGIKSLVGEIAQRDKLANDLSRHVGTFDHSEMTTAEVAAYGIDKLGIKGVAKGQEMAALTGYLAAAKVPSPVAAGMDAKPKMSALDSYLNGSN